MCVVNIWVAFYGVYVSKMQFAHEGENLAGSLVHIPFDSGSELN